MSKDLQAPLTYSPVRSLDHVTMSIDLTITIGVNDCNNDEEINNFHAILIERIKTTGAKVDVKRAHSLSRDPYTGSLREKLYMNSLDESKPTKDDYVH